MNLQENNQNEFSSLFKEFLQTYLSTRDGRTHIDLYARGRKQGRQNFDEIVAAADRGQDVTQKVLLKLLPHNDSASNRDKGAWIHVAPAVTGDVQKWFEANGWTEPQEWPRVAQAILDFVRRCNADPSDLPAACREFDGLPYTTGFQAGMLTPILNALRPDAFMLVNNKSRRVINHLAGTSHSQKLAEYPDTNATGRALLEELAEIMHRFDTPDLRDQDLFDIFSHWLVAEKDYDFRPVRYWKIAPGEGAWNWEACRDGGFIALGWDDLGDVSGLSRSEFNARRDQLVAEREDWNKSGTNQVWRFSRIREGDRVVANRGTSEVLGIGRVVGPYYYVPNQRHGHRLPVEWDDLTPRQVDEYGWRRTLVELDRAKFEQIRAEPDVLQPAYPLAQWAAETYFDATELARWVRAIRRKGQVILYGPPGTGKTFMAEHMARHLIGGGNGFVEMVQFHPAYAYEDFIQGIRPQTNEDGGLNYPLVPGRFLTFCREAKTRQDPCVLIIDEINRANLARVFGELMYLLEYRDREVPLAGGGKLRIPKNVYMIGTMNTADRSIALVDHALRRRFAFLGLYPRYDVLRRYHAHNGFDPEPLIRVLERLNLQIGDRNYEVGITFFLHKEIERHIKDVWRMEIEPYLEEYFFDQPEKVKTFRWEQVGREILP